MAIKNFLFMLVLVITLASCQTAKKSPSKSTHATADSGTVVAIPEEGAEPTSVQKGMVAPVAIFLGPGGMRSFAHIGVLRALQRAKVPIVAVAGSEWGAIVGAQFAMTTKANDVEWQMMKLKKDQLPEGGIFRSGVKLQDTQSLYSFLNFIFGDKDLDRSAIPFDCPTTDGDGFASVSRGKAREQLIRCVALPPFYELYDRSGRQWMSGAVLVYDWVTEFRKKGAQYFIYVDVISRGNFLGSAKIDAQTKALWTAVRFASRQNSKYASIVIEVPLDGTILDFNSRRDTISAGERAAQGQLADIIKAINL